MSEASPSTTSTSSTISQAPGDSGPTVDELDNLFLPSEHRVKTVKKESKETKEVKESKGDGKTKDLRPDVSNEKADPPKERKEPQDRGAKKEGDGQKELEAEKAKIRKAFKGKFGDSELEIDEDTEFFVKVDGQEVPVKAKDLFGNYSGKVAWDKRFNELNQQRRKYMNELSEFDKTKAAVKAMFQEQDPNVRMFKMAELAGVSPLEFRKNFFDQAIQDIEKYSMMTEDERKALDLEFENRYLKYQAETTQKTLTEQQAMTALQERIKSLTQKSGVSEDQFHSTLEQVVTTVRPEMAKTLERAGKFAHGYPTPEFIVETIKKEALWSEGLKALEGIKTNLPAEAVNKQLFSLVEDAHQAGISPEDFPEVINEVLGKGRAKRVVERVEREREVHYEGERNTPQWKPTAATFFDEL